MTTRIIIPCIMVGARPLKHRWRYEGEYNPYSEETEWRKRCTRCHRWWNDVHAAFS